MTFLADTVRLEYAENAGAFLSLGSELPLWLRTVLFTAGTGLILAFAAVAVYRAHSSALPQIGLALLLGGGISNLADRIRHGAVVDFLNVGIGSVRTGIFNLADMVILLGVALLVVGRSKKSYGQREPQGP